MKRALLLALLIGCLAGCSGEAEPKVEGETVSTGTKMSREQASQLGALLPGNKQATSGK